ncbi:MAG: transglycosylase SLT domain-containing protein [Desulfatibacillum sp.]|nr:transglycosylase SLT domain-containing protein [Desulfatibacillum sp.]
MPETKYERLWVTMRKLSLILILAGLGTAFYLGLGASGFFQGSNRFFLPGDLPGDLTVRLARAMEPKIAEDAPIRPAEDTPNPTDEAGIDPTLEALISPDEDAQPLYPEEDDWEPIAGDPGVDFPSVAEEFSVYVPVDEPVEEIAAAVHGNESIPSLVEVLRVRGPLSFCGEPVPLDNPEVRERLEKELMLSLWDRPQVLLWIKRSTRFMPIIEAKLEDAGLPRDLRYVAVAESALRPHAGSPKGAMGFWQFIKGTGKRYGLEISNDVDERREIRRSTEAAVLYFQDLYQLFGSWTLAAAAYNMGEEGLESQILVQEQINYYHLYLPLETQRYIFRILSAKILMENPEKFGFSLAPDDYYPLIEVENVEVVTMAKAPLTLVAKAAQTSFKQVKDLNPHLRGYDLAAGEHIIMVPKGAAQGFNERFETLFAQWFEAKAGNIYIVKPGDTLTGIAEAHGVPLPTLAMWNRINLMHPIHPGQRLLVYKKTK